MNNNHVYDMLVVGGGNSAAADALTLSRIAKKGLPHPPPRQPAGNEGLS